MAPFPLLSFSLTPPVEYRPPSSKTAQGQDLQYSRKSTKQNRLRAQPPPPKVGYSLFAVRSQMAAIFAAGAYAKVSKLNHSHVRECDQPEVYYAPRISRPRGRALACTPA